MDRIKDCGKVIFGIVEHPMVRSFGYLFPNDDEPDYLFVGEGESDHACASWPLPDDWRTRLILANWP